MEWVEFGITLLNLFLAVCALSWWLSQKVFAKRFKDK